MVLNDRWALRWSQTLPTIGLFLGAALGAAGPQPALPQSGPDQFFESEGVTIRYTVSGEGAPVVLLHGFGGGLDDWRQAPLTSVLAPRFQLIAMDVRGHGQSDKPADPEAYGPAVVEDVIRLLDHLGLPRAHIVGYSMGARMALSLIVTHQERLYSAVLVGSGVTLPEDFPLYLQGAEALESGSLDGAGNDGRVLGAMLRGVGQWAVTEQDLSPTELPILAIAGTNDPNLPGAELLARLLPAIDLIVVPGQDHGSILGSDEFTVAASNFLAELDAR